MAAVEKPAGLAKSASREQMQNNDTYNMPFCHNILLISLISRYGWPTRKNTCWHSVADLEVWESPRYEPSIYDDVTR